MSPVVWKSHLPVHDLQNSEHSEDNRDSEKEKEKEEEVEEGMLRNFYISWKSRKSGTFCPVPDSKTLETRFSHQSFEKTQFMISKPTVWNSPI